MYVLMKVIFKTNLFIWFSHFQTQRLKNYSWFIFLIFNLNIVQNYYYGTLVSSTTRVPFPAAGQLLQRPPTWKHLPRPRGHAARGWILRAAEAWACLVFVYMWWRCCLKHFVDGHNYTRAPCPAAPAIDRYRCQSQIVRAVRCSLAAGTWSRYLWLVATWKYRRHRFFGQVMGVGLTTPTTRV
jgi:hypothetical protein